MSTRPRTSLGDLVRHGLDALVMLPYFWELTKRHERAARIAQILMSSLDTSAIKIEGGKKIDTMLFECVGRILHRNGYDLVTTYSMVLRARKTQ